MPSVKPFQGYASGLAFRHIPKLKGACIFPAYVVLRIWMEQTLFCYDGPLIHAFSGDNDESLL